MRGESNSHVNSSYRGRYRRWSLSPFGWCRDRPGPILSVPVQISRIYPRYRPGRSQAAISPTQPLRSPARWIPGHPWRCPQLGLQTSASSPLSAECEVSTSLELPKDSHQPPFRSQAASVATKNSLLFCRVPEYRPSCSGRGSANPLGAWPGLSRCSPVAFQRWPS